jgi:hypothetical protein
MRWRRLWAVAAVVAGIAAPVSVAAPPAPVGNLGGIGVRLLAPQGGIAASALAHTYVVGVLAPGTSIRRRVEIGNSTGRAAHVAVYSAAATIRRGLFVFASGRRRNDLASWTRISRASLRLPPRSKTFVTLTVNVPSDASRGEHYAVVWAELAATVSKRVRLVNRVGVRLYVTVGPGGKAPADFTIGPLSASRSSAGDPVVRALVSNNGTRTLLIGGDLTLSNGPGGSRVGPLHADLNVALSPGGSAEWRVLLGRSLPRGPWSARVRLSSGQLERVANARLRFPVAGVAVGSKHTWGRALPLALGLLGVLAVVAAGRVTFRRARPTSLRAER